MKNPLRFVWALALMLPAVSAFGCGNGPAAAPSAPPPPEVLVSAPVIRTVTDYEDFPGRTEAVNSIDIRARVTGYLEKVNFTEGAEVEKDKLLFEIDPRPYKAELARAEATIVQAEARLKRMDATLRRMEQSRATVGDQEYDVAVSDRGEAAGTLGVAKAARDLAELNLGYTKIRAPIDGRISRRYIDPGNLVKADDTVLTSVVSLDPIYAYFDLDERTTLRLQDLMRQGKIKWTAKEGLPVTMGLTNEVGYPRRGSVDFSDNRVDAETGTWRLRGRFPNPQAVLSPGLFVRVRLPIGAAHEAILISEQALGTDQGQKFVYVVDGEGQVSYRRVTVGRLHEGLRAITDGLSQNETVVVSGLQRIVKQGIKVVPKVVPMPVVGREQEAGKKADKETRRQGDKETAAPKGK
jgi:RND family efflux transporter MFP subunit